MTVDQLSGYNGLVPISTMAITYTSFYQLGILLSQVNIIDVTHNYFYMAYMEFQQIANGNKSRRKYSFEITVRRWKKQGAKTKG